MQVGAGRTDTPVVSFVFESKDLALTMAASTNVIEDYPELFDYFEDARVELVREMFPKAYAESALAIDEEMDYTTDGNVIKLTKWTKTLGEA